MKKNSFFFSLGRSSKRRAEYRCEITGYRVLSSGSIVTEYSQPVVEGDDDETTQYGQYAGVVRVAGADVVRLAVYEYDHC